MATEVKLIATGAVSASDLTLTTASAGTNDTSPATTAFVQQEITGLIDSAPDAMNTLNELAAALGDDANFSTTVTNSIATKLPLAGGTLTGNLTMGGMMLKPSGDGGSIGFNRNPDNGNYVGDSGKRRFQINGPDDTGGDFLQIQSYNSSGTHQGNINIIDGKLSIGGVTTNAEANLSVLQEDTGNDTTSAINIHGTGNGSDGTTTTNLFRAVTNNANNWAHGKMFADGFTFTYGNTNTNRLKIENDGQIQIGSSNVGTDIVKFIGNTNLGAPNTANHATGTRISLYDSSSTAWYAIGMESESMWLNSDKHTKFYVDGTQKILFDNTNPMPIIRCGTDSTNAMRLGTVTAVFPYSGLSLIQAQAGAAISIHSGTNTSGTWQNLATNFPDYLAGTSTFNTINTSQQANIIVYLNVATKTYLVRDSGWNAVSTSGWIRISDDNVYSTGDSRVYVKYLEPGTHSLDNDSALYFFEAPIGP